MSNINSDDVIDCLINYLRESIPNLGTNDLGGNNTVWDFNITNIIGKICCRDKWNENDPDLRIYFADACWILACRGIIRPSKKNPADSDSGSLGAGGNYFSVTAYGEKWLKENTKEYFIFTNADRYENIVKKNAKHLDEVFMQRAKEAASCYQCGNYYASCVMSGAAVESIFLSIGKKKLGEEGVKNIYSKSNGIKKLRDQIKSGLSSYLQNSFGSFADPLQYWRNIAAHSDNAIIEEYEAYEALRTVLRFSQFVDKNYNDIIKLPNTH